MSPEDFDECLPELLQGEQPRLPAVLLGRVEGEPAGALGSLRRGGRLVALEPVEELLQVGQLEALLHADTVIAPETVHA